MIYATLNILIEFCYNKHLDWAAEMHTEGSNTLSVIADKFDQLLDVLVAADRWLMPDLYINAQRQVIAGIQFFIRPDNIEYIKKVADKANARELRDYYEEYSIRNAEAVLLANAESAYNRQI